VNGPLFNAFRLKKVKRLNAVKRHAVGQLNVERVVLSNEMICCVQVLFAIKTKALLSNRQASIAGAAYPRKPTIQKNIRNLSHNYGAKMRNED
jgi:hypothetical protein